MKKSLACLSLAIVLSLNSSAWAAAPRINSSSKQTPRQGLFLPQVYSPGLAAELKQFPGMKGLSILVSRLKERDLTALDGATRHLIAVSALRYGMEEVKNGNEDWRLEYVASDLQWLRTSLTLTSDDLKMLNAASAKVLKKIEFLQRAAKTEETVRQTAKALGQTRVEDGVAGGESQMSQSELGRATPRAESANSKDHVPALESGQEITAFEKFYFADAVQMTHNIAKEVAKEQGLDFEDESLPSVKDIEIQREAFKRFQNTLKAPTEESLKTVEFFYNQTFRILEEAAKYEPTSGGMGRVADKGMLRMIASLAKATSLAQMRENIAKAADEAVKEISAKNSTAGKPNAKLTLALLAGLASSSQASPHGAAAVMAGVHGGHGVAAGTMGAGPLFIVAMGVIFVAYMGYQVLSAFHLIPKITKLTAILFTFGVSLPLGATFILGLLGVPASIAHIIGASLGGAAFGFGLVNLKSARNGDDSPLDFTGLAKAIIAGLATGTIMTAIAGMLK